LKDFFFKDLQLREPDYQLEVDTSSYGREVADVVAKSDDLLANVKPDALVILGDTFSGLSVLPAAHRGIKTFHMEAGLRAWDKRMPEQRNRILIDHMSDVLLPFNRYHRENLLREGIHPSKIFVTGNPTFEVMRAFLPRIKQSDILKRLGLSSGEYFLVTAHRSENVDHPRYLEAIIGALGKLYERHKLVVLYPMHPRTRSKLGSLKIPQGVQITAPFGFYDFNHLLMNCRCILSDSGTAPEESYFYKVPCVSLRMTTERPETVEGGAHIVAGLEPTDIVAAVDVAMKQTWAGRYDLEDGFAPSSVVINCISSHITNFF
jgi:UDP-N-acetylglucosamine 2-epimerase (non-hydrolysing)